MVAGKPLVKQERNVFFGNAASVVLYGKEEAGMFVVSPTMDADLSVFAGRVLESVV